MPFDPIQPQDDTKVRNVGVVIRPNWAAIAEGDKTFKPQALNLDDRTAAGIQANPTPVEKSYVIFSKQDSDGKPQLWGIDPSSVITQITGSGGGGGTIADPGSIFIAGGLIMKWGSFVSTGTAPQTITYPVKFPSAYFVVMLTPAFTATGTGILRIDPANTNASQFVALSAGSSGSKSFYVALGK